MMTPGRPRIKRDLRRLGLAVCLGSTLLASSARATSPEEPQEDPDAESASPAKEPAPVPITPELLSAWLTRRADDRTCSPRAVKITKDSAYVACGRLGLWVIRFHANREPEIVERRQLGGDVVDLFERGGRLWAEVNRIEARPVVTLPDDDDTSESEPPVATPHRAPPEPKPQQRRKVVHHPAERKLGHVVAIEGDTPVVDLGSRDGLSAGDRIEVLVRDARSIDPKEESYSPIAVGKVVAVSSTRARVEFGLDERIPVGARARVTRRPLSASSVPPRLPKLWEVSALAGPLLATDDFGGGLFVEARASYRFESASAGFVVDPLAFAFAEPGAVLALTAFAFASLDSRSFELGIGVGGQTVNDPGPDFETGSGTVIPEFIRLGSRDGLHLALRTDVVLFHKQFSFSGMNGTLQIPSGNGTWLVARAGGSMSGYALGELGLRALLRGRGDRGSSFITVTAGWANLFEACPYRTSLDPATGIPPSSSCEEKGYEGPILRVGLERRF